MSSYDQFLKTIKNAPRINSLAQHFEGISSGQVLAPLRPVIADTSFMTDPIALLLHEQLKDKLGKFNQHCYASIPYAFENCIRIMTAMYHYANERKASNSDSFSIYEVGAGTGDITRTLPAFTQDYITSLCSSASPANEIEFNKYKTSANSHFYVGPYFDITPAFMKSHASLNRFSDGFDIIFERCTFQMYGKDRENQVQHLLNILKEDGILILDEKFADPDPNEFVRREKIKDELFKSQYFDSSGIDLKKEIILNTMNDGLVTLDELTEVLRSKFKCAVIIWNSTNFYTVVASNSAKNLNSFIAKLMPPCIPPLFSFMDVPKKLFGL